MLDALEHMFSRDGRARYGHRARYGRRARYSGCDTVVEPVTVAEPVTVPEPVTVLDALEHMLTRARLHFSTCLHPAQRDDDDGHN